MGYFWDITLRAMMAQAAIEADVDPDRVSFTRALFQLVEMMAFPSH